MVQAAPVCYILMRLCKLILNHNNLIRRSHLVMQFLFFPCNLLVFLNHYVFMPDDLTINPH